MSEEKKGQKETGTKQFDKRIKKLEKKLADIKVKISALEDEKKKINTEISHVRDEQILYIVKSSNLSIEQITESIRLAFSLQQSGQQSGYKSEDVYGSDEPDVSEVTEVTAPGDYMDMTDTFDMEEEI